ncbi:MAG: cysteine peptidase family C39 domain-containing protein [Ferruginibacter sp.]
MLLEDLFEEKNKELLKKLEAQNTDILNQLDAENFDKTNLKKTTKYSSPFGNKSLFTQQPGYVEYVNFQKLLKDFREYIGKVFYYDYINYESHLSTPVSSLIKLPEEWYELTDQVVKIVEEFIEIPLPEIPLSDPQKRRNIPFKDEQGKEVVFSGKLNIASGEVSLDSDHILFGFDLDPAEKKIAFTDYFLYKNSNRNFNDENVAISISAGNYEDYQVLSKIEKRYLKGDSQNYIVAKILNALKTAKNDPDTIGWLYSVMPDFVLNTISDDDLWNNLKQISKNSANSLGILKLLIAAFPRHGIWVKKVQEEPFVMHYVFENFTKSLLPNLIGICMIIGAKIWQKKNYDNAISFLVETLELQTSGDNSLIIEGYCDYNSKEQNYEVGVNMTPLKFALPDGNVGTKPSGYVNTFDPLKVIIGEEVYYIPAFIAYYLSQEKLAEARKILINDALLLMMPGDLIIVNNAKKITDVKRLSQLEIENVLKDLNETGASLSKSFFENAMIKIEKTETKLTLLGQMKGNTCAASSLRMVLADMNITRSEEYLAAALKTEDGGASILDIPAALENSYLDKVIAIAQTDVSMSEFLKNIELGDTAIVSLFFDEFKSAHAVIADGMREGKIIIRDPLPQNIGSSYLIEVEKFKKVFNKKVVYFKK